MARTAKDIDKVKRLLLLVLLPMAKTKAAVLKRPAAHEFVN